MFDLDALNHIVGNSHLVLGASDPGHWIDNLTDKAKEYGAKGMTLLGTALLILAAWFLFKIIASKSGRGKYALLMLGACIAGGVLLYGGIEFLQSISSSGYNGAKGLK